MVGIKFRWSEWYRRRAFSANPQPVSDARPSTMKLACSWCSIQESRLLYRARASTLWGKLWYDMSWTLKAMAAITTLRLLLSNVTNRPCRHYLRKFLRSAIEILLVPRLWLFQARFSLCEFVVKLELVQSLSALLSLLLAELQLLLWEFIRVDPLLGRWFVMRFAKLVKLICLNFALPSIKSLKLQLMISLLSLIYFLILNINVA